MQLRDITLPYVIQERDYAALRQAIEHAFAEEYGVGIVDNVRVAHFNPAVIDVTVVVQEQQPKMDDFALALSEALRRQGVHAAMRITASKRSFKGEVLSFKPGTHVRASVYWRW